MRLDHANKSIGICFSNESAGGVLKEFRSRRETHIGAVSASSVEDSSSFLDNDSCIFSTCKLSDLS